MTVHHPDSIRDSKEAVIKKLPPWSETVVGEEHEHTEKALVAYPGTSIDGGNLFADITEAIHLDNIEV